MIIKDPCETRDSEKIHKRNNPNYPPNHVFTVRKCEKCGENYEPLCSLKHICKKQNSYPIGEK